MTEHWMNLFEDRYGSGAYARLMGMFDRPCVTFAEIGGLFGVSRERVRQIEVRAFEKVQKAVKDRVAAMETPALSRAQVNIPRQSRGLI